jgi:3-oxoacyl-[acyl-carrier-protein] synthase-1
MNSTVTMNLSNIFKLKGVNFTVSAACASGSHAYWPCLSFYKNRLAGLHYRGGAQEINHLFYG